MTMPTLMYGRKYQKGVNWITTIAMTGFHIGALAAFFFIDAGAILAAAVLWVISGCLGIGMAYHRLLTHRGYTARKWVEYFLTFCGTLALEGGPIFWVATHRIHHQKSDREGDPHSPREGTYWAHIGWIFSGRAMHHDTATLARYAPVPWLIEHEWAKHGSCMAPTPERFPRRAGMAAKRPLGG